MIKFENEKMTDEQIHREARVNDWSPLKVAINHNGYRDTFKYWCSVEEVSCINLSQKYGVVVEELKRISGNSGMAYVTVLYRRIRQVQPFVGRDGIFHDLTNNVLPSLQDAGIICRIGDTVYVHPALVGMDYSDVKAWCNQYRSDVPRPQYVTPKATIFGYDADEVRKAVEFYRKYDEGEVEQAIRFYQSHS